MKRLYNMRWTLVRRALQLAVLGLFAGTARLGWTLAGEPLLDGTLSASEVAGTIPLSDPLALLERLAAGHMPTLTAGLGALIVLVLGAWQSVQFQRSPVILPSLRWVSGISPALRSLATAFLWHMRQLLRSAVIGR